MTDERTKARAKARQREGLKVHLGDPIAGKDTLTADLQPISPNQSFEFSITEAKVQRQALQTALAAGDEITVAITAPALTTAIEHAQRAIDNSAPGRAAEMRAELEPIERDAERLIAQRDAANLSADRLVEFAVNQIDGDQSYKVLFNVIAQAKNQHVLPQVAHELRARPHRVHGNYLDALTRLIRLNGSGGLRDLALAEIERAGVASKADASVVRMSGVERLMTAAKLGAPDIPLDVIDQLAGFLFGLPIAIGIGALIAAEVIPAAAVSLLLVPVVIDVANDLTAYRDLSAEAATMGDLRAAGAYLAKVIAVVGLTALLAFVAKAKAGKAKTSALRKPVAERPQPRFSETKPIPLDPTRGAGKTISGWTRSGWKFEVTMGGANEVAALKIKVTIKNVQSAAKAPTAATAEMRALLHEQLLIDSGKDAGHGVASAIATCEELFNYFNENPAFIAIAKRPSRSE